SDVGTSGAVKDLLEYSFRRPLAEKPDSTPLGRCIDHYDIESKAGRNLANGQIQRNAASCSREVKGCDQVDARPRSATFACSQRGIHAFLEQTRRLDGRAAGRKHGF